MRASGNAAQADGFSGEPSFSADGRFVAFSSSGSNLVAGDTNGAADAFVLDRQTASITRVSVASDGTQANSGSADPKLSADGRFVAFRSNASNLVPGDTNGLVDVFVHDRVTHETSRVSISSSGTQGTTHIFTAPALSADGRFAFVSSAPTLVSGDTNGSDDVFVHDRQTAQTTRVSVASDGAEANLGSVGPKLSADGRFVAFQSGASNLVAGDTNADSDIFVHDRQTGETTRVSVTNGGGQVIGSNIGPALSADGRFVAFHSGGNGLVAGDLNGHYDVVVHDRQTGQTSLISRSTTGAQGNFDSAFSSISADGRYVAFLSPSSTLASGDTNGFADVFVHDRQTGETVRAGVAGDGSQANQDSEPPALSAEADSSGSRQSPRTWCPATPTGSGTSS